MARTRAPDQLRPLRLRLGEAPFAEGSALIEMGSTRVLCTASVEDGVPPWLRGRGQGWVTAEYGMLPRSTPTRQQREAVRGRRGGRTVEISRLIGRSLRAAVDLQELGERTVHVDCDVLQADGGTRCAAVTGGMTALAQALDWMVRTGLLPETARPLRALVAAVSVGLVGRRVVLDLDYDLDVRADVDMNVVMTEHGRYVEVQATAEGAPFTDRQLGSMKRAAAQGIAELIARQRKALAGARPPSP